MLLCELKLTDEDVAAKHALRLISWYDGGTGHDFNNTLLAALKFAHSVLPYEPYGGDLYRAQRVTKNVEPDKIYTFKSGKQPITSWTTSKRKAINFRDDFIRRNDPEQLPYVQIVKLVSPAKELCNLPWIKAVSNKLLQQYPENISIKAFVRNMKQWHIKQEDEVIVKLPDQYQAKVL